MHTQTQINGQREDVLKRDDDGTFPLHKAVIGGMVSGALAQVRGNQGANGGATSLGRQVLNLSHMHHHHIRCSS